MTHTSDITGLFDADRFRRMASDHRSPYLSAEPYPHVVIDSFLPEEVARTLGDVCPLPTDTSLPWVTSNKPEAKKQYIQHEPTLHRALRDMFREFNSFNGLLFFERLTGIESLIPDPFLTGGGVHISGQGDFLKIHADFNWHHKILAYRRINAILFLTENWQEEWGGRSELWNSAGTECVQAIVPRFNRLLVFETSESSFHGHPAPLETPPDVYRKSLNLYYYHRHTRPDDPETLEPHWTKYCPTASPHASSLLPNYQQGN